MWQLRTFGGLSIETDGAAMGVPRRRPLALLALLAVAGERGLSREKVVALLWPESDEEHGRNSLSQALAALRREMSSDEPVMGSAELRLNPAVICSDVGEFERCIASGGEALERAAALYQGPFLDGFFVREAADFERWTDEQRRRLHDLCAVTLERLARHAGELADYEVAVAWWRRFAALEPTSSKAVSGLMCALAATGDRAGARRQYRVHEELMRQEFGAAPDPAVSELAATLLSVGAVSVVTPARTPNGIRSGTSGGPIFTPPALSLSTPGMLKRALVLYAITFAAVGFLARAAIIVIGLPDWVFPGALIAMALGLPVVLVTGYVAYIARRVSLSSPVFTPAGTPSLPNHGTIATLALKASPHISWRRTARVVAWTLAAFVIAVAAWMTMRVLGIGPAGSLLASGKLAEDDQILVADFKVPAADSALSSMLATLMTSSLSQSRAVHLVPASTINATLTRMRRSLDSKLDFVLARELAARDGIRAIVTGEAIPLGAGYVVTVQLVAQNGDVLWQSTQTPDGAKELTKAIDRLSRDLRARVGESLRSVRADPPLAQTTTASLEALRKYTEGVRALAIEGNATKAWSSLEEAIRIDTAFGAAFSRLAISLGGHGVRSADQVRYADRAFALQDRLSEPERLEMLAAHYLAGSRRDQAKGVESFLELGERYPLWPMALQNRATVMDEYLYEHARAESTFARAIQTLPDERWSYTHIVRPQIALGEFDAAHRSVGRARVKAAAGTVMDYDLDELDAIILYNEGRIDSALSRAMAATRREAGAARLSTLLSLYAVTGRRAEFWSRLAMGRRVDAVRGVPILPETDSVLAALSAMDGYSEDPAPTLKRLDALATPEVMSKLSVNMLLALARAYAKGSEPDCAKRVLTVYDRDVADRRRPREDLRFRRRLEGFVALAERKGGQALAIFREVNTSPYLFCPICMDPDIAQAFEVANLPDSALVAYEHYANTPYWNRPFVDEELPMTLRRIGEIYEARGNRAEALKYYQRFADLWKNADPPLQPKVAEVKRRMIALRADGVSPQINSSANASSIRK